MSPADAPGPVLAAPPVGERSAGPPLLEVDGLRVTLVARGRQVHAVDGLSYRVAAGQTVAIIGESGSGKTVSSRAVMGLLPPSARVEGHVRFAGVDLVGLPERELRRRRAVDLAIVLQDPARSLDPTMRIGPQITEAIRAHLPLSRRAARERAIELLGRVRIPEPRRRYEDYPHQLSGGMRQRVVLAAALSCNPKLLIADEATTALDVTTQAQIMHLLVELQAELGMALVLISHDLGLAATYTDEVVVMYAGRTMEHAPTRELFHNVRSPYTKALLGAIPRLDRPPHDRLPVVQGRPPDLTRRMQGCPFHLRCPSAAERCAAERPPEVVDPPGHRFACFFPHGEGNLP